MQRFLLKKTFNYLYLFKTCKYYTEPYIGGLLMSNNKFEQLIEYVVNDEEEKAKELFHEIVIEKSRSIYENLMAEDEELDEAEAVEEDEDLAETEEAVNEESDAEKDDHAEKAGKKVTKDIEYDDKMDEGIEEELGGDAADDLIDDIEVEEEGLSFEDEESEDLEDRVVDLEDKLDELMAEFEEMMNDHDDEDGEEIEVDAEMDDMEIDDDELETESYELDEAVDLTAAPKPETSEPAGTNTKSTVAANSGAKGAVAKPVSEKGGDEKGRPAPKAQDMGGTTKPDEKPAPKADNNQAAGVNTKSVID